MRIDLYYGQIKIQAIIRNLRLLITKIVLATTYFFARN